MKTYSAPQVKIGAQLIVFMCTSLLYQASFVGSMFDRNSISLSSVAFNVFMVVCFQLITLKLGMSYDRAQAKGELISTAGVAAVPDNSEPILTTQVKFDPISDRYPEELDVAVQAWSAVQQQTSTKQPKEQLNEWLKSAYPGLSTSAKDRIILVCNWNKKGGAPKTPG